MRQYAMTTGQRDLLAFITQRIRGTGVAPSFEEMRKHLCLASKSGVHRILTSLEERGQIVRLHNRSRAIALPAVIDGLPPDIAATALKLASARRTSVEAVIRSALIQYDRGAA